MSMLLSRCRTAMLRRPHLGAATIFAAAVIAYLWPVLIGGRVLSSASYLYDLAPWRAYAPADLQDYYNAEHFDFAQAWYPTMQFVRELLHAGVFPAWDPYSYSGTSLWANPGPGYLSPFTLPFWALPLNYAFGIAAALKLWVAAFGAYLLTRELRLGFWPGIFAGLAFGFCSFNIVWMPWLNVVAVWVLLPWALLFAERLARRGQASDGIWLTMVFAVAFFGGHPPSLAHLPAVVLLYAVLRLLTVPSLEWRQRLRRLALTAAPAGLAALIVGVTMLPAALAIPETLGERLRTGGYIELPHSLARMIFFPDWWGRPSGLDRLGARGAFYTESAILYPGAVALMLAAVALTSRTNWRRKLPFAVLALVALDVGLRVGPFHWFGQHLPPFGHLQNTRVLIGFALAVAILGAFGLERLTASRSVPRSAWAVLAGGLVIGLSAFALLSPSPRAISMAASHFLTGTDFARPQVIALTSIVWWLLLLAGSGSVLWFRRELGRGLPLAVLAVLAFDILHFAGGYLPMAPADQAIPTEPAAIKYLQRHAGTERVWGKGGQVLPADTPKLYGLRDIQGYQPPEPDLRYWRLLNLEPRRSLDFQALNRSSDDWMRTPVHEPVLDLLGVRYVMRRSSHITQQQAEALQAAGKVGHPSALGPDTVRVLRTLNLTSQEAFDLGTEARSHLIAGSRPPSVVSATLAYRGEDALISRNRRTAPRVFAPDRVVHARDERGSLERLSGTNRLDPTHEAVVEGSPVALRGVRAGRGEVRVVREANAWVEMRAKLRRGGLVVLNERLKPGWRVTVDGRPARALRANDVLRGVMVPAGEHTIRWSYRVPGLRAGLALTLLGLTGLAGWAWISRRRSGGSDRRAKSGRSDGGRLDPEILSDPPGTRPPVESDRSS